ncbi:nitrate reductase molybdenum cofactor assembly chaperone [Nocardioides daeguensis]|uniref:Nitrate reductase molybdenum cofactor assembly chaperone n=1 Tax=Nocardioides daeguensis TaxID=908359 RepID=A0ABP6W5I3_9ACTN|nr:nitrate reductase molybdenum cofactor assembly chaperone [Nocardioides daeguensis]MBV6727828.1 nitrate reductase molybdenum cofactor assembly chaperone [Nocardioides daeguensis]MCR1775299.1 nitrate reductase molybdenum cofactor assembly chaperone [Nocardioides daeguensis]
MRRRARVDVRAVWAACSVLLDYPTAGLVDSLDDVEALVAGERHLAGLVTHLRTRALPELQAEYVATFDHTRKCALYLTYFAYGDTRRRGQALVRFKEAYREAGVAWDESTGELPDHLCAVLQFGATVDVDRARRLLTDHRAGVEMLRLALTSWRNDDGSTGSPWAGALDAVCATLPELRGDEADAVRRLVEQGPPAEEVGLDGYGPALIAPATLSVRS